MTVFILHSIACQAGILKLASIIIPTVYITTRYNQSNNDYAKMKRLIRKDKDYGCQCTIDVVERYCDNEFCKDVIQLLKDAQSTQEQKTKDLTQEHIVDPIKETEAYKAAEKMVREGYNSVKQAVEKDAESKK